MKKQITLLFFTLLFSGRINAQIAITENDSSLQLVDSITCVVELMEQDLAKQTIQLEKMKKDIWMNGANSMDSFLRQRFASSTKVRNRNKFFTPVIIYVDNIYTCLGGFYQESGVLRIITVKHGFDYEDEKHVSFSFFSDTVKYPVHELRQIKENLYSNGDTIKNDCVILIPGIDSVIHGVKYENPLIDSTKEIHFGITPDIKSEQRLYSIVSDETCHIISPYFNMDAWQTTPYFIVETDVECKEARCGESGSIFYDDEGHFYLLSSVSKNLRMVKNISCYKGTSDEWLCFYRIY